MQTALKIGATLIEKGVAIWQDPAKAVALAEQGGALTAELAKLALMRAGLADAVQGQARRRQARRVGRAAAAAPRSRRSARRSARRSTTCCCPASPARCATTCVDKGDAVDGVMLRALVPVNLRPLEKAYKLGNQFGLVFLELPIGIENPVERLYAVRANMRALKGSYQPVLTLGLLAADRAPGRSCCRTSCCRCSSRNATAVMTNVPGPQQPLYLAGAKIERLHVLGAAVGRHRHGRVDPLLQRQRAVRPHHRPRPVPGSGARHRALRGPSSRSWC